MKCDEARYFIQGILNELNSTFKIPNRFVFNVYRDGGSMDISIKTDGYDNIVFVAPIAFGYGKKASINTIQILKKGCVRFEDCYNKENVVKTISVEVNPWENFNRDVAKKEILKTIYKVWGEQ